MDSLDLIQQFLTDNGIQAVQTTTDLDAPGRAIWLPDIREHIIRAGPTRVSFGRRVNKIFDLHDPNSLQDILAYIKYWLTPVSKKDPSRTPAFSARK